MPLSPFALAWTSHNDEQAQGKCLHIFTQMPPFKAPNSLFPHPNEGNRMALPQMSAEQEFHHCFLPSLQFSGETFENKEWMTLQLWLLKFICQVMGNTGHSPLLNTLLFNTLLFNMRWDPKSPKFIYKKLCIYSHMFKLQSPSKCSPFDAIPIEMFFPLLKTVFELVDFDAS